MLRGGLSVGCTLPNRPKEYHRVVVRVRLQGAGGQTRMAPQEANSWGVAKVKKTHGTECTGTTTRTRTQPLPYLLKDHQPTPWYAQDKRNGERPHPPTSSTLFGVMDEAGHFWGTNFKDQKHVHS